MKVIQLISFFALFWVSILNAQTAPDRQELTDLLNEFLKGASEKNAELHDRFWAEDLIYTSSSGTRFGKKEIMEGLAENTSQDDEPPSTVYSAEDVQIRQYDDMAIIAFRLVGKTKTEAGVQTDYYLNSGTFIKRDNEWKVVNWQATKVPDN